MNGSFWRLPLRITWPLRIADPVARAGDDALDEVDVGALVASACADLAGGRLAAAALVVLLGAGRRVEDDDVADVAGR